MITVSVTDYGEKIAVEVTGHAGYAEHGSDIVCAGVTALVMGLNLYAIKNTAQLDSGYYNAEFDKRNNQAIDMFINGIREIERLYPDYCELR